MSQQALSLLTGTLTDLARELGMSYDSVRSWAQGRRTPTTGGAKALATLCRKRSKALAALAEKLEREGGAQ